MALIESKGCTMFPEHGLNTGRASCCDEHDRSYGKQDVSRDEADRQLLECGVRARYPWRAIAAYIGVRLFGWVKWYWIRWTKGGRRAA